MCFVFHALAFDDVIRFEYPKSENFISSRMKRAFEENKKTFCLFSQVLTLSNKTNQQKCGGHNLKVEIVVQQCFEKSLPEGIL